MRISRRRPVSLIALLSVGVISAGAFSACGGGDATAGKGRSASAPTVGIGGASEVAPSTAVSGAGAATTIAPSPPVSTQPHSAGASGAFDMCQIVPAHEVSEVTGRAIARAAARVDTKGNLTAYNCSYLDGRGESLLTIGLNPYSSFSLLISRPGATGVSGLGDDATWFGYGLGVAIRKRAGFIQIADGKGLVEGVSSIPEGSFAALFRLVEARLPADLPELERGLGRGMEVSVKIPAQSIEDKIALLYDRADGGSTIAKCGLVDSAGSAVSGPSSVAIVASGLGAAGHMSYIELATIDPPQVPGTVKAGGKLRATATEMPLSGLLTFNSDRVSGSFQMKDGGGAPVTGTFNCAARL